MQNKVKIQHFVFGLLFFCCESFALEVCSQNKCKKIEMVYLVSVNESLNKILGLLRQDDYIKLCKSNVQLDSCASSEINYLILGGWLLPMRAKISGYKIETKNGEIDFVADSGMATCTKTKLFFGIENNSIILKNPSTFFCNWLGVGNVVSSTSLKLKKIDIDKMHFYGDYTVSAVGTAVGRGEGLGSFQILNGERIVSLMREKYGDSEFVGNSKLASIAENKIDDSKKNDADQLDAEKSVADRLVAERQRFEKESRDRDQIQIGQSINLQVTYSQPNSEGDLTIAIDSNSDTASLKINGVEQGGRADGKYTINRVARAGQDTKFEITAKDIYGNTDTKTITVSRPITDSKPLVAALNPAQVKKQPERDAVAVIIGIADYKNLPRADFANDDARVFYDYAIRALGVKPENIKLLVDTDADQAEIYRAFKTWLPGRVRASTDVYVYYSGHGLPSANGQELYLLPQRADRDFIDKTGITQAEINSAIQSVKPKSVTIFLDACYSGQTRSGETLLASARPVALKSEKQLFPDNFTVITASQADQISSSSPDLKHGIFSYYLMRGMEGDADANRDGRITAGEMQAYLLEQVARQAGMQNRVQQPQLIGDSNRVLVGR